MAYRVVTVCHNPSELKNPGRCVTPEEFEKILNEVDDGNNPVWEMVDSGMIDALPAHSDEWSDMTRPIEIQFVVLKEREL
jgi:hypothetical protein